MLLPARDVRCCVPLPQALAPLVLPVHCDAKMHPHLAPHLHPSVRASLHPSSVRVSAQEHCLSCASSVIQCFGCFLVVCALAFRSTKIVGGAISCAAPQPSDHPSLSSCCGNANVLVLHEHTACGWPIFFSGACLACDGLCSQCQDAILALNACHDEHPLFKFFGACNAAKAALDSCLADEYLIRREMNSEAAAESNARLRERRRLDREDETAGRHADPSNNK